MRTISTVLSHYGHGGTEARCKGGKLVLAQKGGSGLFIYLNKAFISARCLAFRNSGKISFTVKAEATVDAPKVYDTKPQVCLI